MNINEIAKMAGVSRAAVSRYLNDGYLSKEKKEAIKKVIDETGYIPSPHAQMLRTKKTKMIGVILPKINSQSISRMVAGISEVIDDEGYQLLLANTRNNVNEEIKYINVFRENHVDGMIFIATVLTEEHEKALKKCDMPVVILGQLLKNHSSVYQDDYNAAKDISMVLLENSKKPAFIGVIEKDIAVGLNRRKGFLDAIKEKKIEFDPSYAITADFSIESGYEKMKELYERASDLDAVMCVTESIAIGAMAYLKDIGKKIPEEIKIVGMGDSSVSKVLDPKISTVHFHYHTSGVEVAKMLIDEIKNPNTVKKQQKMSYKIIVSESTN